MNSATPTSRPPSPRDYDWSSINREQRPGTRAKALGVFEESAKRTPLIASFS
jgi:hypothetical protein